MRDPTACLSELARVAPGVDRTLLRVLARVLTAEPSADLLLSVSDACEEAAVELVMDGQVRVGAQMVALGGVVAGEATLRSRRLRVWW
jgi:hypothetical protein